MSRAVLSIGSKSVTASPTCKVWSTVSGNTWWRSPRCTLTAPWGVVEQQDFLNAIVVVDDPGTDAHGWLRRGQELEASADRVRDNGGGPAPSTSTSSRATASAATTRN